MIKRINTGIFGLDSLFEGGFLLNTVTGVIGCPGTGKSTFALQFALEGLYSGNSVLYLTFEETAEKLIAEATLLGFGKELKRYQDEGLLIFNHTTGEEMVTFLTQVLPNEINNLKEELKSDIRVIIDPLTPILWELEERRRQRSVLTSSFDLLREFGTLLVTLEEPMALAENRTMETAIPMYLVDNIINLQYLGLGGNYSRTLRILKSRGTKHGELVYPITFVRGTGVIVFSEISEEKQDAMNLFDQYIKQIEKFPDSRVKESYLNRLHIAKQNWDEVNSPEQLLKETLQKLTLYRL